MLQKVWIIWSPLLYFNFKIFMEPNSLWFIRVQCILHDSGVLFSEPLNFYKLKSVYLISGGNQFCRKSELFCPLFCSWILKVLWSQNCWSLVRFQCSVHDWGVLFSESWNFLKLKRGGPNFLLEPILQKVWNIWSSLLYFNIKSFMEPKFFVIS